MGVLTEQFGKTKHLPDAVYRSCLEEGQVELFQHTFLDSPAFAILILKYCRSRTINRPGELAGCR